MYPITLQGDFLMLRHPEHGVLDIAKLIPNPLAKSPEWEKLVHQMAAGPRLAAAAEAVLEAWGEGTFGPTNRASVPGAVEAIDRLRYAVAAADPDPRHLEALDVVVKGGDPARGPEQGS